MKRICILGATGSVGVNTLRVIRDNQHLYEVQALTANSNITLLLEQCRLFKPACVVTGSAHSAKQLSSMLAAAGLKVDVDYGPDALAAVASAAEVDTVMAAIVGGAGLLPTMAAAKAGKRVLLANKEALVMAGSLFMEAARTNGATVLPIDSEHNAIFQCLPVDAHGRFEHARSKGFRKIVLTASGGPFHSIGAMDLSQVTPDQACKHPNWRMGRKISVDSATLINKALELIEACYLFDTAPEKIDIVVHPQSIVHSLVYYSDGSVLAQLGNPDMRTPIAHGLAWPDRIESGVASLDLATLRRLDFIEPDHARFPGLGLGRKVAASKGAAPIIFNAANEIAVAAFLGGKLGFDQIPVIIDRVLQKLDCPSPHDLEDILAIDQMARLAADSEAGILARAAAGMRNETELH
jgi:1-deoxy-D-xylulose-5-phosphate reductoisomerase